MKNTPPQPQGPTPPSQPQLGKVLATMTVTLHEGNKVFVEAPPDGRLFCMLMSGLFASLQSHMKLDRPSPILQPPPGFRP